MPLAFQGSPQVVGQHEITPGRAGLGLGEGERDTCLSLSHMYVHTFLGLGNVLPHKDMFYDYTCIFMTKQSHICLRGSGV